MFDATTYQWNGDEMFSVMCCSMSPRRVIRTDSDKIGKVSKIIEIPVPSDEPIPVPFEPLRTGWICPRCGKSNSPEVRECDCYYHVPTRDNVIVQPWAPGLIPPAPLVIEPTGIWPGSAGSPTVIPGSITVTTDNTGGLGFDQFMCDAPEL